MLIYGCRVSAFCTVLRHLSKAHVLTSVLNLVGPASKAASCTMLTMSSKPEYKPFLRGLSDHFRNQHFLMSCVESCSSSTAQSRRFVFLRTATILSRNCDCCRNNQESSGGLLLQHYEV